MSVTQELGRAIEANDGDKARHLLTTHAGLADSTEETPPPIHWAIYQDKREMVELLLDHGADLERRDQDRDATPLDYAIVYARKDIIRVLVARGANVEGRLKVATKGAAGGFEAYGELPSRAAYAEVVELLHELGVNG